MELRERNYEAEARAAALAARPAASHPLQVAGAPPAEAAADEPAPPTDSGSAANALPVVSVAASDPLSASLLSSTVDFDPLGASGGGGRPRRGALDHNPIGVTDKAPKAKDPRKGARWLEARRARAPT